MVSDERFRRSHRSISILVGIAVMGLSRADAQNSGMPRHERTDRLFVVQSATKRAQAFLDSIAQPDPSARLAWIEELSQAILGALPDHQTPDLSQRACRTLVTAGMRDRFDAEWNGILQWANTQTRVPISADELRARLGEDPQILLDRNCQTFLTDPFDALFREARARAVDIQRRTVDLEVELPAQAEIDEKLADDDDWDRHREYFTERLRAQAKKPATHLLEENQSRLNVAIVAAIAEVGRQYRQQSKWLDAASETVPAEILTTEAIYRYLDQRLHESLAAARAETGAEKGRCYDLFFPVMKRCLIAAREIELQRLKMFVGHADLGVSSGMLAAAISESPEKHKAMDGSRAAFQHDLAEPCRSRIAADYAARLQGGASSGASESAYFVKLLSARPLADTLKKRIAEQLDRLLPGVREGVAADQFGSQFLPLVERRWTPSVHLIESRFASQNLSHPTTLDQAVAIMKQDGLDGSAIQPDRLLDETRAKVITAVGEQLSTGDKALQTQLSLVRDLELEWAQRLTDDIVKRNRAHADISAEWVIAVTDRWNRNSTGGSAAYPKLWDTTRAEIEKAVRKHYDTIRSKDRPPSSNTQPAGAELLSTAARRAADSKAVAREAPGTGTGGSSGAAANAESVSGQPDDGKGRDPGLGGTALPHDLELVLIDVPGRPGRCIATVEGNVQGLSPVARSIEFDVEETEASAQAISRFVWPQVQACAQAKVASDAPRAEAAPTADVVILVTVFSDGVRHRTSIWTRAALESMAAGTMLEHRRAAVRLTVTWIESAPQRDSHGSAPH